MGTDLTSKVHEMVGSLSYQTITRSDGVVKGFNGRNQVNVGTVGIKEVSSGIEVTLLKGTDNDPSEFGLREGESTMAVRLAGNDMYAHPENYYPLLDR